MPRKIVTEDEEATLVRDNEPHYAVGGVFDWMLRQYYPDEVERLKGDADIIGFTKVTFPADDHPHVVYSTWDEVED